MDPRANPRSHVPKFGNWDSDNVPYTAYFENARKDRGGGVRINPNDPEQNPEAFNFGGGVRRAVPSITPDKPPRFVNQRGSYDQQKNESRKTGASESSSDKSPSDHSVTPVDKPKHQRKKSDRSTYVSDSRNLPSPGPYDDFSYRSVSVPKFGQWDNNDPRSAEGFTVIFNKVKEEKQIAASHFPPVPPQTTENYQAVQEKQSRKKCCCLF